MTDSSSQSENNLLNVFKGIGSQAAQIAQKTTYKAASAVQNYSSLASDGVRSVVRSTGLKDRLDIAKDDVINIADAAKATTGRVVQAASKLAALNFEDEEEEINLAASDYDLLLAANGVVEKSINIRSTHVQSFNIPAGNKFVWKARVKKGDIGFGIKLLEESMDVQAPIKETDIIPIEKYGPERAIVGELPAVNKERRINLIFDNSNSHIMGKNIAYWVAIGENVSQSDETVGAARLLEVRHVRRAVIYYVMDEYIDHSCR